MRYLKILVLILALSPAGGCFLVCAAAPKAQLTGEAQTTEPSSVQEFVVVVYREYIRPIFTTVESR